MHNWFLFLGSCSEVICVTRAWYIAAKGVIYVIFLHTVDFSRTHGAINLCFVKQGEYWPCYNWNAFHDTLLILQSKYAPSTHGCQNVRKGLLSGNIILIYDHAAAENRVVCLTWELVSPWHIIDESNLYLRRKFDTIWEIPPAIDDHELQICFGRFISTYMSHIISESVLNSITSHPHNNHVTMRPNVVDLF